MNFSKAMFMKIIWHRISIQTLLFQDVFAYSTKWRRKPFDDKAYYNVIAKVI